MTVLLNTQIQGILKSDPNKFIIFRDTAGEIRKIKSFEFSGQTIMATLENGDEVSFQITLSSSG